MPALLAPPLMPLLDRPRGGALRRHTALSDLTQGRTPRKTYAMEFGATDNVIEQNVTKNFSASVNEKIQEQSFLSADLNLAARKILHREKNNVHAKPELNVDAHSRVAPGPIMRPIVPNGDAKKRAQPRKKRGHL